LGYLRAHREVSVRTLLVDRVVNLMDEGVDVAVRIGPLPDSSLTAVPVGQVRRVVCASPAFLREHGVPEDLEALQRRCTITAAMEGRSAQWRFMQDGELHRLSMESQLTVTSFQAAVLAACEGWGLTQVVSYQVARHLQSGALQVVLREFEAPPMPVHVVYPEGRRSSAKVRSFVEFCVEALRRDLAALPV
jgi:DNA-binding transcriptional LysR family regulator